MRYEIGSHMLAEAVKRIEKANNRLAKAGIADRFAYTAMSFTKTATNEGGVSETKEMIGLELSSPSISFGGFTFVARVEALEDGTLVTTTAPDQDLDGFVPADMKCEHCGINRYRTATYIVRDQDGQVHQVGKSCLNLFTGVHVSGLWALEYDLLPAEGDDERDSWGFGSAPAVYTPLDLVAAALALSNLGTGFKPSSWGMDATSLKLSNFYFDKPKTEEDKAEKAGIYSVIQSAEVQELAAKVLTFAQNMSGDGDYPVKVRALAAQKHIQFKFASTLVSAIIGYNKSMEREIEAQAQKLTWNNELLGQPKDKLENITATVKGQVRTNDTQWGTTYVYKFQTETGQVMTWFASNNQGLVQGDKVVIVKATVKGSDTYQGFTSTTITRATVQKV